MRILYVSGGSAGHLAPLVAVERAMKRLHPDAESLFLCSDRPEDAAYLRHERVTFQALPRPRRSLTLPYAFLRNYFLSRRAVRVYKPDVVFSKGGAVSVPACMAAKLAGIPVVLHESDAVMGKANAMVARFADTVCLGFPLSRDGAVRTEYTGNPVRPQVTQGKSEEGLRIAGLSGGRPVLLVFGGSQGAEALNAAVRTHIDELLKTCDVIHLTGKGKKGASPRDGYWSTEFAYAELPHFYAAATLALGRAGAGSISELAANGIPAILVPIEGLANDHQVRNAEIAAEHGGCALLRQRDLEAKLATTVADLIRAPGTLENMSRKIRSFQRPDAARRIAEMLSQCIARRGDRH